MEGLYIRKGQELFAGKQNDYSLLAKCADVEIITQYVSKEAVVWLKPTGDSSSFEFFYILSGELCIECPDRENILLNAGDSFSLQNLTVSVPMKCLRDATTIYVTNRPAYDYIHGWQKTLMHELDRIEDKDKYTFHHSQSVMKYATDLYKELCPDHDEKAMEDFILGALFHDIGKCNIPTDILNKTTRLSDEEFAIIRNHALESQKMLEPIFGEKVAELAGLHHERMNGSGYPSGVQGDKIPIEARILMVADSFDAMTSDRVYKKAKGMEEAALELYNMKAEYDPAVTEVLLKMVREGRFNKIDAVS